MSKVSRFVTVAALVLAGNVTATAPALAAPESAPAARAASATAVNLYVNNRSKACSDRGPGSRARPFCSIQAAANATRPGTTVNILGTGKNYGPVTISRSGTAKAPIVFLSVVSANFTPHISAGVHRPLFSLVGVHDVALVGLWATQTANQPVVSLRRSTRVSLTSVRLGVHPRALPPAGAGASALDVDGASSDIRVTSSQVRANSGGATVAIRPGARRVTLSRNVIGYSSTRVVPRRTLGSGIVVDRATSVIVNGNSVQGVACAPGIFVTGRSTAIVVNNVVNSIAPRTCTTRRAAAIGVETTAARGVRADYNALHTAAPASLYLWKGKAYSTVRAFRAATGHGGHDLSSRVRWELGGPPEKSPLIDSADNTAPGAAARDADGNRPADDPLVRNTGRGRGYADRGAYERHDQILISDNIGLSYGYGPVPLTITVDVPRVTTSSWGYPVTYTVDFGDGTRVPATARQEVRHTYTTPGHYAVWTTARTSAGYEVSTCGRADAVAPGDTGPTDTMPCGDR